jgi:geranylgeranyl pyrophosphate synthase
LLVLDHPILTPEEKYAICDTYQRQLVRAHLGQSLDLFWTNGLNESQLDTRMADSIGPKILQMYALKTAAPVEGVAQVASMLAKVDATTQSAVLRFARSFGLAFQLIDDVNNFTDSPAWGKLQGEDLKKGKLTYLLFRALQELPAAEGSLLRDILCRPDLRAVPAALNRGIDLVLRSGACDLVRKEARDLIAPAWAALSLRIPPSSSKTELRLLWESLVGLCFDRSSPIDS